MKLDNNRLMGSFQYPQMHKLILFTTFASVALYIMTWIAITNYMGKTKGFLITMSFLLPLTVNLWETLLITILTINIQQKFTKMNSLIRNQKQVWVNLRRVLPRNKQQTAEKFEQQERVFTVQRIREIMETHYYVTALCKQLNEMFGYPILITIAVNFVLITLNIYYFMEDIFNETSLNLNMLNRILWTTLQGIEIIFILAGFQGITYKVSQQVCASRHLTLNFR